jgi:hypothetical protein
LRLASGRHPFQVGIAAAVPVVVVALALNRDRARALTILPWDWLEMAWLVLLAAGGAGALVGAFWRGRLLTGLSIEGAAVTNLATMVTLYLVLLVAAVGPIVLLTGGLTTGIACAAWARAVQIYREYHRVVQAAKSPVTATVTVLVQGGPQ